MKLLKTILLFLFFLVFGQTSQTFAVTSVQLNMQTESSIVTDNLSGNEGDFLHSEIARTCNFERSFVNYWKRDARSLAKGADEIKYLSGKGFSAFEEIDDVIIFRDANNRIGKVLDKTKLDDITWFTPKTGNTWPIHETNVTDYLKFKYGNKVSTQVKVRTYHKNGTTVDGYLDDLVETSNTDLLIIDAKHSQKAQIVDGKIPGYTTGQTQTYQWITDGNAVKIEIIGDGAVQNGLLRGTDILPRLKGKVGIITNDANGQMVELSVYKTIK